MKCPECNTDYNEKLKQCPYCGAPNNGAATEQGGAKPEKSQKDNEPRLGRGMMAFIVIGLVALAAFSAFYYMAHRNDPDYFRTLIEPDTTLADRNEVRFETAVVDTAAAAKEEEEAKREAEKMYNSIRRQPEPEETTEEPAETTEPAAESNESTEPSEPVAEPAPTPKVEAIE